MTKSIACPLLTAEEVHQKLSDPATVLFDCRYDLANPQAATVRYGQHHIPGSYHLHMTPDLSGPVDLHGGRHPLPAVQAFQATMRRFGVNQDSLVIAYDDGDGSGAARLWWLMKYFGHRQTSVLNGGLAHWRTLGLPTSARTPEPRASGDLVADPDPQMIVDFDRIQRMAVELVLLDSRSPERYRGDEEPIDRKAGHIPSALSWDYRLTQADPGLYHHPNWLRDYFRPLEGRADQIVAYCGSGVTACVNLLALSVAGIDAQLYPGSWSDWISYSEAPVATGVERSRS